MKVLLVEDEQKLAQFIKKGFQQENMDVEVAADGLEGKRLAYMHKYEVIILDVNLPHINGFELCTLIRKKQPDVPILMLTALDSIDDKAAGFDSGADDYLVKPFEFKELLMRVKSLTKRIMHFQHAVKIDILQIADLQMDRDAKVVTRGGKKIDLTHREYALLEYLLLNKGKVLSKIDISEKVWDIDFDTGTNVIEVYINYLRKKIDKDFTPKLLHTVVGMGYVLKED
jgi:two-component system, OmpR family, copper resistance phosphate regulon response regulator CusR